MELGLRLTLITVGILILLGLVWDYQRRKARARRLEREQWEQESAPANNSAHDPDLDGWEGRVEVYDQSLDDMVSVGEVRIISRERPTQRRAPVERPHVEPRLGDDAPDFDISDEHEPRRAPTMAPQQPAAHARAPEPPPRVHAEPPPRVQPEPEPEPEVEPEPEPVMVAEAPEEHPEPARRRGLFGRHREEPEPAPEAPPAMPEEVYALHVVAAPDRPFPGPALLQSFAAGGLSHGRFDIFHYMPVGGGEPLFSVANMVKPGTFDPDAMESFTSPGLAMFMGLPGPRDPRAAFESMLSLGRRLAEDLGGELRDDRRNILTGQTVQSYRDRIAEFERTHLKRH